MQAAATTIRLLTGCSSKAGFADSEGVVSNDYLLQLVASHLVQTASSQGLFLKLTNSLTQLAEHAYLMRDLDSLEEVSRALMSLPADAARQMGLYYHALAIKRKGDLMGAQTLLASVADNAPISYRARAIQALGASYHDKGELDEALRFQHEALRAASDNKAQGLQTILRAHAEVAILRSITGDHKSALANLEDLWPLFYHVAKQHPFYFYVYHNELAVELGEVGRIEEAKAACKIALASPFAAAYPEWSETHDEIATKRVSATPSFVAVNRAPETEPSAEAQPQRQSEPLKALARNWLAIYKTSFQRSRIPIPARATTALNAMGILDRVLICIGPRAPPARR